MNKTVFITGTSSGFGRETARYFHQQGWNVVATMRSPEQEQELTQLPNVLVTRLDVQDQASITQAVAESLRRFGRLDVLINNAGYSVLGVFESSTPEQIRALFDVNLFGLMDVTRTALPHLRQQGNGVIINISSFAGQVGMPFGSPYISTKFAVEGFSEALFHELYALGIAVKLIEPGSVATNFRNTRQLIQNTVPAYDPLMQDFFKRLPGLTAQLPQATAEEVAHAIYKAATDGLPRLRYAVGADGQFYLDQKNQRSDQDYTQLMRQYFSS